MVSVDSSLEITSLLQFFLSIKQLQIFIALTKEMRTVYVFL